MRLQPLKQAFQNGANYMIWHFLRFLLVLILNIWIFLIQKGFDFVFIFNKMPNFYLGVEISGGCW